MEERLEKDEERAKELVDTNVKILESDILSISEKPRVILESMITCLSEYYSLNEMKTHMASTVEKFFDSLFVDDELGRDAYVGYSLRRETIRQEAIAKVLSGEEEDVVPPREEESTAKVLSGEEDVVPPREEEAYDEETVKLFVSGTVEVLQMQLESITAEDQRLVLETLVSCLLSYSTLQEMQTDITSLNILDSEVVTQILDGLFVGDETARRAYFTFSVGEKNRRAHSKGEEDVVPPREEKAYDEETIARNFVAATVEGLQVELESIEDEDHRLLLESFVSCLLTYSTLEEMQMVITSEQARLIGQACEGKT